MTVRSFIGNWGNRVKWENPYKLLHAILNFYFYMFQPIQIPLISHITAAPPPKSTAPMGCPSCWPEVAPADPVTRPFQWDMLDVFKRTLVPPEALAHSCGRDTECLNKGIAQASFKQGQSSQAWHGLRGHTNRYFSKKKPALPASSSDIWNLNLEDHDTARI